MDSTFSGTYKSIDRNPMAVQYLCLGGSVHSEEEQHKGINSGCAISGKLYGWREFLCCW